LLKFQGKVTDTSGNPVAGAQLTVTKTNVITPLPVIYTIASDGSIIAGANPFNSDSNGEYVFAVESGSYSIEATGSAAVLNISKTITQYQQQDVVDPVPVTLNSLVFTSASSWNCPTGVIQATITCLAGGSGGQGGGNAVGTGGAGGAGGATVRRTIGVNPGQIYAITIGGGGNGGAPGLGAGSVGGDTSFGGIVTASGQTGTTLGYGGPVGRNVVADTTMMIFNGFGGICSGGSGGAGGNPGSGSVGVTVETYAGGAVGQGAGGNGGGGGGGSSPYGAGGKGGNNTSSLAVGSNGVDATGFGAGGGGGSSGTATGGSGGKGTGGLCIVEWIS